MAIEWNALHKEVDLDYVLSGWGGYELYVTLLRRLGYDGTSVRRVKFTIPQLLDLGHDIKDIFWVMRYLPKEAHPALRIFASRQAAQVLKFSEEEPRARKALQIAVDHATGNADFLDLDRSREVIWQAIMETREASLKKEVLKAVWNCSWHKVADAVWTTVWIVSRIEEAYKTNTHIYSASEGNLKKAKSDLYELINNPPEDGAAWAWSDAQKLEDYYV